MNLQLVRGGRAASPAPWKVLAEGLAAGVAGTALMTQAQTKVLSRIPAGEARKSPRFPSEYEARNENATETFARRVVEEVAHRDLEGRKKKVAGQLVHYATGATLGTLFAAVVPKPKLWHGALFGAAAWMLNDNVLLPLLRVGDWPNRYGVGLHLRALGAHLVFGVATAWALRREAELTGRIG